MRERSVFLVGYYFYWLIYFIFTKAVFLLYHQPLSKKLPAETLLGIFWHGLALDLSFSAYLCAIPFLVVAFSAFIPFRQWLAAFLLVYTSIMIFVVTFLCTADLELFRIWGFRLDASPLNYLNTPGEMFVSVGNAPIWLLVILNILINLFFSFAYRHQLHPVAKTFSAIRFYWLLPLLFITALLILPLRGGLQEIPINQSSAYFSRNHFANQAAINLPWNFFHALSKWQKKEEHPYLYTAPAIADSLVDALYKGSALSGRQLLNTPKPNIILIIWESFTAKVVAPLGGLAGVTPHFNRLSEEGLLFTRAYASGDRTDKGLVAILSGYPSQPITTIIKTPQKSKKLPQLSLDLAAHGYQTAYFYGGELGFGNMRSYLSFGDWQHITGVEDFSGAELNSKWGAHDGVVLNRMTQTLDTLQQPFFATILTLSSHEPFDIPAPAKPRFPGKNHDEMFISSHYYTDSVVGAFIDNAKKQPWWNNTLIVILGDHGHVAPGNSLVYQAEKYHIPMLWLGGALQEKGAKWPHTLSQTDLAATLMQQLGLPTDQYVWSKNTFAANTRHFAPFFFKDGVSFMTDSSFISWDHVGKLVIEKSEKAGETELKHAKAYLQSAFTDYLGK
ncbi:MAG: sulfatase-like hydrolase/transferase [Bacteroidetes bacterium]|nr:sulfatase-like hydrolase/transferase [Bacteroidota bacterium]